MADISRFRGPLLKIERASHHMSELDRIFHQFIDEGGTHELLDIADSGDYSMIFPTIKKPFPDHVATVVGDAIHNLRASLDHLYIILVELNGKVAGKHAKFPIGEIGYVKSQLTEKNPNPSAVVMDCIFNEIRPFDFPEGDGVIAGLHDLDIADKHVILIPVVGAVNIVDMTLRRPDGTAGPRFRNLTFHDQFNHLPPGFRPLPFFAEGMKAEQNKPPELKMMFGDGQPFAGEGVIETLRKMSDVVELTVRRLAELA